MQRQGRTCLLTSAAFLLLSGCGGSGSNGNTPGKTKIFSYRAIAGKADLVAMNNQGLEGFAFVSNFGDLQNSYSLYLNEGYGNYYYRESAQPVTSSEWLEQLRENGRQGYIFKAPCMVNGSLRHHYVKNTLKNDTFEYQLQDGASNASLWLSQANNLGSKGFIALQSFVGFQDKQFVSLYVKNSGCSDTFAYTLDPLSAPQTVAEFQQSLSSRGNLGWAFCGQVVLGNVTYNQYMQCSSVATIAYRIIQSPSSKEPTKIEDIHNTQAREGYCYYSTFIVGGKNVDVYYKSPRMLPHPLAGFSNP